MTDHRDQQFGRQEGPQGRIQAKQEQKTISQEPMQRSMDNSGQKTEEGTWSHRSH